MDNLHQHYSTQTMGSAEKNNPDMENKKLLARASTKDEVVHCPRCDSPNTKFCYYNNYSLSQPRYFCKGCRRYWTQGGTLRNVPVGGGSRKNRRPLPSPSSIDSSNFTDPPSIANNFNFHNHQNPSSVSTGHHELNIGFPSSSQNSHYHDVVSKGITLIESSGNPSDFQFPGGFANSSLDNSGFASFHRGLREGSSDGGARVLFPAEDLKPVEQNHDDGYWSSSGSW